MGIGCYADCRETADGQQIEWIAHVSRRQNEFLPGRERQRSGGVKEADKGIDVGLAAHESLGICGGIREALRGPAKDVGARGWRHAHASRSWWAHRRESRTPVIVPLPAMEDSTHGSAAGIDI